MRISPASNVKEHQGDHGKVVLVRGGESGDDAANWASRNQEVVEVREHEADEIVWGTWSIAFPVELLC